MDFPYSRAIWIVEDQAGNDIFCHMHVEIAGKIILDELTEVFSLQRSLSLIALDLHEEDVLAATREACECLLLIRAIAQKLTQ